MGSHFTNDDLVKESRIVDDYDFEISFEGAVDGVEVYEFTMTPRPEAPVVWGRVEEWERAFRSVGLHVLAQEESALVVTPSVP